jgi:hypothetical protein
MGWVPLPPIRVTPSSLPVSPLKIRVFGGSKRGVNAVTEIFPEKIWKNGKDP